jgi:hypothetical protein
MNNGVLAAGEDRSIWISGDRYTIKCGGNDMGGAFALIETVVTPGNGPPPHIHSRAAIKLATASLGRDRPRGRPIRIAQEDDFCTWSTSGRRTWRSALATSPDLASAAARIPTWRPIFARGNGSPGQPPGSFV